MLKTLYFTKKQIIALSVLAAILVACVITLCFMTPSASAATQTQGLVTFADNSLTNSTLVITFGFPSYSDMGSMYDYWEAPIDVVGYSYTKVTVRDGDKEVYSEVSNWVTSKDINWLTGQQLDSLAKDRYTINVLTLVNQGKISAGKNYNIVCSYTVGASTAAPMEPEAIIFMEGETRSEAFSFTLHTQTSVPPNPTKTGYTFTGWYTDEACTNRYTSSTVIDNMTLYAGWRPNTYTIKFDGNGKTSGSMSNLSMTYDQYKPLTANSYNKTGYAFRGWATSANGGIVYTDGQSVVNLTANDGATITLYAVWEQVTYTVAFNANGGTGTMNNQTHTKDVAKKLTTVGFERTGYTFQGWATSATGAVVYTNCQQVTNIGEAGSTVTLYAVWTINKMTVKYHANDGTGSMSNQVINYGATADLTNIGTSITRQYYTFKGWATSPDGEVAYTNCQAITNTNTANCELNLYAVWERNTCIVTFIVDGEVYAYVEVPQGTTLDVALDAANINLLMYKLEGEHSQNF